MAQPPAKNNGAFFAIISLMVVMANGPVLLMLINSFK